jgi:hypothetical protein
MLNSFDQNIYRIDRNDLIVSVNAAWDRHAISNDAPELTESNVVNHSLWDFVSDAMTRHIYQQMLVEVRNGKSLDFEFRCDSPDRRQFLEMRMTPLSDNGVQFETVTNYVEDRSSQELYRRSSEFTNELIVTCSWCKKIKVAENVWYEVEKAIQILKVFVLHPAPRLSHGMCEECYAEMARKLGQKNSEG